MNTVTQNIKLQKRVNFVSSYFLQMECGFSDNSITQEAYFLRNGFLPRAIFIRLTFYPPLTYELIVPIKSQRRLRIQFEKQIIPIH